MTFNESPLLCAPLTLGKIGRISNGLTTNHFPTQLPRISSLTEHPTSSREPMQLLLIPEYWVSVPCNTQSHLNKTVTFSFGRRNSSPPSWHWPHGQLPTGSAGSLWSQVQPLCGPAWNVRSSPGYECVINKLMAISSFIIGCHVFRHSHNPRVGIPFSSAEQTVGH